MTDVALNGLHIQLSMSGPHTIVLTAGLDRDFTEAGLRSVMDMLTAVADRERLKAELENSKAVLRRNREMLAPGGKLDQDIDNLRQQRADADKKSAASWVASGKRGAYEAKGRDKTVLDDFDQKIEMAIRAKHDVAMGLAKWEWDIDCLYARINGLPEPPMTEKLLATLPDLKLPEDVGFQHAAE